MTNVGRMTAETDGTAATDPPKTLFERFTHTLWRLIVTTVGSCLRYRVAGLAAEAAFFAVLSVPPLVFALAGAIGYVSSQFSAAQVEDVRDAILDMASQFLTDKSVDKIIEPTINNVLDGGRFDVISLGFVLALWSGSRALNVFVDTITIMHGLGGHRGIVKTRALSFALYLLAMVTGIVTLPLVVAGPRLVDRALPERFDFLMTFYWPIVIVICICFLATLYHVSVPVRTNWTFNLPGRGVLAGRLDRGFLLPEVDPHRHRRRLPVDLRPARGPDRHSAVALHPGHRRAHRSGRERRLRHCLSTEEHHEGPAGADGAAADHRGQPDRALGLRCRPRRRR